MFDLQSITSYFGTHGKLRKSQRTTLAALVWALMRHPVLGIAALGHSLAMAHTTTAKHAIKRVDRFLGNDGIDLEVACGDLIATVIGSATRVFLTLDWTDPKTKEGRFQTLSMTVRAHGRAMPIAWMTVAKVHLKDHMREYEEALCDRVARLLPEGCHPIVLADRGFATARFVRFLDGLGWDWIIRGRGGGSSYVGWGRNDRSNWMGVSGMGKRRRTGPIRGVWSFMRTALTSIPGFSWCRPDWPTWPGAPSWPAMGNGLLARNLTRIRRMIPAKASISIV